MSQDLRKWKLRGGCPLCGAEVVGVTTKYSAPGAPDQYVETTCARGCVCKARNAATMRKLLKHLPPATPVK